MAKILKEIQRIIESVAEIDRSDADKSTTELWCLNASLKLQNEIKEALDSVENYKKATPLLEEARKTTISIVKNAESEHQDKIQDKHLKKLADNCNIGNTIKF